MGKKKHGHKRFYELLREIAETHSNKNFNYSKENDPLSNLRMSEEFGIPAWKGVLIRMNDKFSRIQQLASGKEDRVGESIIDTLKDLAVYALLDIILFEEKSEKSLKKNK